jgi:hypothetical protein
MRKPATPTKTTEVANREKQRAAAYARMGRNDVVEPVQIEQRDVVVASNGRLINRWTGRYVER